MKKYIFRVRETYAGSRDGEIIVYEDDIDDFKEITEEEQQERAEEKADEMYKDHEVEWAEDDINNNYGQEDIDYDIDFDYEEDYESGYD